MPALITHPLFLDKNLYFTIILSNYLKEKVEAWRFSLFLLNFRKSFCEINKLMVNYTKYKMSQNYWYKCQLVVLLFYFNFRSVTWVSSPDSSAYKMKFSIKDFFSKCDQIRIFLWIWSHLLKKPLMEDFIFCAVSSFSRIIDTDQEISGSDFSLYQTSIFNLISTVIGRFLDIVTSPPPAHAAPSFTSRKIFLH